MALMKWGLFRCLYWKWKKLAKMRTADYHRMYTVIMSVMSPRTLLGMFSNLSNLRCHPAFLRCDMWSRILQGSVTVHGNACRQNALSVQLSPPLPRF
ncbi:hypothetical protein ANANG_G00000400 [Anguilla anguilla]|uniref:Uncharacterized protein n=1 Tax=Anguilla anguilla TaxID=7936 RepID=A0A9D3MVF5_ANGAN|nr:hypothetical protein ANANG_G00000400 [Anguilla anguilla]